MHTLTHDLVDFPILLTTDKLLVLVRQLNLDTYLILSTLDEWYLVDDHHGGFDSIVGAIDGKCQLFEAYFRTGVGTNI